MYRIAESVGAGVGGRNVEIRVETNDPEAAAIATVRRLNAAAV
jgi:hypothetical protein